MVVYHSRIGYGRGVACATFQSQLCSVATGCFLEGNAGHFGAEDGAAKPQVIQLRENNEEHYTVNYHRDGGNVRRKL